MYVPVFAASLVALGIGLTISRDGGARQWAADTGLRLAEQMRSDAVEIRSGAIEQTHYIATFHPDVDLSATVPALVDVYKTDPVPRYRLAAVATLHALGDDHGMRAVSAHLTEQTDRYVQIVSIAALRDHYGTSTYFKSDEVAKISQAILAGLKQPPEPPSEPPEKP